MFSAGTTADSLLQPAEVYGMQQSLTDTDSLYLVCLEQCYMHTCHYWFIHLHGKPNRMLTFEAVWIFYPLSDQSFFFLSSLFRFPWLVQTLPSLFIVLREKAVSRGCSLVILPLFPPFFSLFPPPFSLSGVEEMFGKVWRCKLTADQCPEGAAWQWGGSVLSLYLGSSLTAVQMYRGAWFMKMRYGSLPYTQFSVLS